jgi:hypothetical protein
VPWTLKKIMPYNWECIFFNPLPPNVIYICRTAPLTSRRYILNISSTKYPYWIF